MEIVKVLYINVIKYKYYWKDIFRSIFFLTILMKLSVELDARNFILASDFYKSSTFSFFNIYKSNFSNLY